jgi:hypothetical protein
MNLDERRSLEDYIRGNHNLVPTIAHITMVDSAYSDPVQLADLYARLARRVVEGEADEGRQDLCDRLMKLHEITGGLHRRRKRKTPAPPRGQGPFLIRVASSLSLPVSVDSDPDNAASATGTFPPLEKGGFAAPTGVAARAKL